MTQPPQHLYRYLSLKTEQAKEHARKLIVNREVYFARSAAFNDPFESRFTITAEATRATKINHALKMILQKDPKLDRQEAKRIAKDFVDRPGYADAESLQEFTLGLRRMVTQGFGMICMCRDPDGILMWSHYADSHQGICVELRYDRVLSDLHGPFAVTYSSDVPTFDFFHAPDVQQVTVVCLTKAQQWSYEKEWRYIDQNPTTRKLILPAGSISSVILGSRCRQEHEVEIRGWIEASGQNIALRKAIESASRYQLDIAPID